MALRRAQRMIPRRLGPAVGPASSLLPQQSPRGREISGLSMVDKAKQMLNKVKGTIVQTVFQASFTGLSIEEKERMFKIRGLVEVKEMEKIRKEVDEEVRRRVLDTLEAERKAALEIKLAHEARQAEQQAGAARAAAEAEAAEVEAAAEPERLGSGGSEEGTSTRSSVELKEEGLSLDQRSMEPLAEAESSLAGSSLAGPSLAVVDPILGKLLHTHGNRQLFMMDIPNLTACPVWEKQRVYRKERALKIAGNFVAKRKRREAEGLHEQAANLQFPGVITLYERAWEDTGEDPGGGGLITGQADFLDAEEEEEEDAAALHAATVAAAVAAAIASRRGRLGIVDGQHRVGALRILHSKGLYPSGRVLVEVFAVQSEAEIAELFTDINKAEPVRDVDLPGQASNRDREMLVSAVEALEKDFPDFFKGAKCRRPNVNADILREEIFRANVIKTHGLKSDADLLGWLLERNAELEAIDDGEWLSYLAGDKGRGKAPSKFMLGALAKARRGNGQGSGFFLGLDPNWLAAYEEEDAEPEPIKTTKKNSNKK